MSRLIRLFHRRKQDAQLDSELRFHVEQQIADNIAAGMNPDEARRHALAQFGGLEYIKEEARDARGTKFIDTLLQDIRFAARLLRKTPLISSIALLSLALGIGANTAVFSLIDAVMLRMLPVQNPEQLVRIEFRSPVSPRPRISATNPIWEQVRDHQDAFSGVMAWSPTTFDLADGGEVNYINGIYASGDYFRMLGVRPAAGRLFAASDDVRNCSGVAVLGYGFWQSHYAVAESAVGSLIRLNGHAFPIVGVAQRGFFGAGVGEKLEVAIPICAEAVLDGKDSMLCTRRLVADDDGPVEAGSDRRAGRRAHESFIPTTLRRSRAPGLGRQAPGYISKIHIFLACIQCPPKICRFVRGLEELAIQLRKPAIFDLGWFSPVCSERHRRVIRHSVILYAERCCRTRERQNSLCAIRWSRVP